MEVKVSQGENGTYDVDPTETRVNPTFVFWYTVSLIWHPTMTTGDHNAPAIFTTVNSQDLVLLVLMRFCM